MIDLHTAMVLAAGQGTRMRPLSESVPKPLLPLAGKPLLAHILDRLEEAGVERAVVNAHHLAEQVEAACAARRHPRCEVTVEPVLRGTGGGVLGALPRLQALAAEAVATGGMTAGMGPVEGAEGALFTEGPWPFAVVNGDSYWLNGPRPALRRMAERFEVGEMDGLLLLARSATVEAEVGIGDFAMDPLGRLRRPKEFEVVPYTFAGVQLLHPRLFRDAPEGAFSLNRLYDRAIEAGRLWGLVHDGAWFHLSTPADLDHAEERLARGLVRFF